MIFSYDFTMSEKNRKFADMILSCFFFMIEYIYYGEIYDFWTA